MYQSIVFGGSVLRGICENLRLNLDKPHQYEEHFADIFNDFDGISFQRGKLNDLDLHDVVKVSKISSRHNFI